jgi:hypothetical protein
LEVASLPFQCESVGKESAGTKLMTMLLFASLVSHLYAASACNTLKEQRGFVGQDSCNILARRVQLESNKLACKFLGCFAIPQISNEFIVR